MNKVYDIETISNLTTFVFKDVNTKEVDKFIIHKSNNQLTSLVEYLNKCKELIGFNNVRFDGQIVQFILDNYLDWLDFNGEEVAKIIYRFAQEVISSEFPPYREWNFKIKQIDLFLILHLNNKQRRASLKDIQFSMHWDNVMDMPIHHSEKVYEDEIETVLEYNLNDVESTYKLYLRCIPMIDLRQKMSKKYNFDFTNHNNGKIGESLLLMLYCKKTGKDPKIVKEQRTERKFIRLIECIPKYIKFNIKEFNNILDFFKKTTIFHTKGAFSESFILQNCEYTYGTGGCHGVVKSGIYTNNKKKIKTCDVASLYPSLAVVNKLYPKHLGPEFCEVYENDIVNVRLSEKAKPKEIQDSAIIDGFKEGANIPYGKSNSEHSFLRDSKYAMDTTISGQLSISMLADMLITNISSCEILMVNTDGLECYINEKDEEKYFEICKIWENITKLKLEYDEYSHLIIRDVNAYIGVYTNGKIKCKGTPFVEDPELWKDSSMKVVKRALVNYYTKGIPVEETINNCDNILDFCKRAKMTKGNKLTERFVEDGRYIEEDLSKTTRYYVSNKGSSLIKRLPALEKKYYDKLKKLSKQSNIFDVIEDIDIVIPKDRETNIEAGYLCTVYNKHDKTKSIKDYDINKKYYIKECYKIINVINE